MAVNPLPTLDRVTTIEQLERRVLLSIQPLGGEMQVNSFTTGPQHNTAVAMDPDTDILRVDFFDGASPIGGQWTAPFIVPWGGLTRGTHLVTAVASDVEGGTTVSAPITVVVTGPRGEEDDGMERGGYPVEQPRRR